MEKVTNTAGCHPDFSGNSLSEGESNHHGLSGCQRIERNPMIKKIG
jgi:hypothetical protein